ncbi:hypothetical protein TWF694_010396 [Orbilia ellipsospora]|uniref:Uncharacterized protein n=1 Tax=Orbilia ellipsospora TaxID=2528407 RepID=A0AAV9XA38_9PEZI
MPQAPGIVKSASGGNRFTASFVIDGIQYNLVGNLSPSVEEFNSFDASLEYNSAADLTSNQNFQGRLGNADLSFSFENGTKITGSLQMPQGMKTEVNGAGTWVVVN